MDEAKYREIKGWLVKGLRDLKSARQLMRGDEPLLDTAVYHCQQAAEKAIKAYLTYRNIPFEKTHNLVALLSLCLPSEPEFRVWKRMAEVLTPYATEFRYPGDVLEPSWEEAQEALLLAESFVRFIIQRMPEDVRP